MEVGRLEMLLAGGLISREEALKLEALMMGMNHHTRRAALESGVEP